MPLVYVDCPSGISGDMFLGALVDAGLPIDILNRRIETLGVPGLRFEPHEVRRCGLRATHIEIVHTPEHKHRHLRDILKIIDASGLDESEKTTARSIFHELAQAESKVHGCDINKVHFHEVGAVDSIADIVGVAVGMNFFGASRCRFSPIPVGKGFVQIAHGRVSLPAPATAELLRGVPLETSEVESELTTPTGAAFVKVFAQDFGGMPAMKITAIGIGAGSRDLAEQANILRLYLGSTAEAAPDERIVMLETNVDDVSGQIIADCCERLRSSGALDVFTTSIAMKKNRPGTKISILCRETVAESLRLIVFAHTHTLGIRSWRVDRFVLPRETISVETSYGPVDGKLSRHPNGQEMFVPEYEACRRIADGQGIPVLKVFDAARGSFHSQRGRER